MKKFIFAAMSLLSAAGQVQAYDQPMPLPEERMVNLATVATLTALGKDVCGFQYDNEKIADYVFNQLEGQVQLFEPAMNHPYMSERITGQLQIHSETMGKHGDAYFCEKVITVLTKRFMTEI